MVEELRKGGVTPSHSVNSALVRVLLQSDKVLMAADVSIFVFVAGAGRAIFLFGFCSVWFGSV